MKISPDPLSVKINDLIEQIYPEAVRLRRIIHQNPELSGQEYETAKLVYKYLREIGLKPDYHLNKTAVTSVIRNGRGKTVALRADMDALPITEETGLKFSSCKAGVMHACGHDMHTATLLGAASVLNRIKDSFNGTVLLIFQPSEEVEPGGAIGLIKSGAFPGNTNAVFGLHVSTDHFSGEIGLKEGADYAGIVNFDVKVKGKGAHGATPEKSVDPIVCAASMVTALQTLVSRETSTFTPAILSIGTIHAGTLRNIIPDQALFQGTLRSHSKECLHYFVKRIKEMCRQIASSYRTTAEVSFQESYPPSFNDPEITTRFSNSFSSLFGNSALVQREKPTMYAEDFSYYQQKTPGLYIHLGVKPVGRKFNGCGIHSSGFTPDETAIKTGIASHVAFACELLK
ncbi:MAG TPA: M20 family metallopeptidase [Chitinispirillaceae bacterium]|jgi:amidohydrolase/hippurate hydrolase|nr:M20 family metallopeptidase [Chitinispirillaceae bacterium]